MVNGWEMSVRDVVVLSREQNELKKEVERRKTGKEMLDFKKKQEEDKTKRLLEERNREKAEERAARERVKQQIALVSQIKILRCFVIDEEICVKKTEKFAVYSLFPSNWPFTDKTVCVVTSSLKKWSCISFGVSLKNIAIHNLSKC